MSGIDGPQKLPFPPTFMVINVYRNESKLFFFLLFFAENCWVLLAGVTFKNGETVPTDPFLIVHLLLI